MQSVDISLSLPPAMPGYRAGRARRAGILLTVMLSCLLAAGCISTRFIYNQLDWLIVWYLNDFFSLDAAQEDELRGIVSRNLDWVRTEQLPEYARLLRVIEAEIDDRSLSVDDIDQQFKEMIGLWDAFLRKVTPDAAIFLSALSDAQVADFLTNVEDNNQELWEDYAGESPEKRLERRQKTAIKGFQRFTGRLDARQRELVSGHVARMSDNSVEWLQGRRAWQISFQSLVQERPPPDELQERLLALMLDPNAVDRPEYRRKVEVNQRIVFQMTVDLMQTLNERQRERLSSELLGYATDFDKLAAQKPASETD
jgi:hypothetical protein